MPRKRRQNPQVISEEDFGNILLAILNNKTRKNFGKEYQRFCKIRNCFIFMCMYYMGLRPKECYEAKIEHIDLQKKTWLIPAYNNKERNTDYLPIPDFMYSKLWSYMEARIKYGFKNSEWLFPARHHMNEDGKIKRSNMCKIFKQACMDAGIFKHTYLDKNGCPRGNINMYSLRHSFGTRAWSKTKDIKKTAIAMRHHDIQMRSTMLYVHIADNEERPEIFEEIYN